MKIHDGGDRRIKEYIVFIKQAIPEKLTSEKQYKSNSISNTKIESIV